MGHPTIEQLRWSSAVERGLFGVWDLAPGLELVHHSPAWKAQLGFPRVFGADSTGFWRCRVHPDDFQPMLDALRAHLDGSAASYEARFRLRSNGAGYRMLLSRGRVVARDAAGHGTRMVGTTVDLTERPAVAASHGLVADDRWQPLQLPRLPFHAVLGAASPLPACGPGGDSQPAAAHDTHGLIDQVDDLLEMALRACGAPPCRGAR